MLYALPHKSFRHLKKCSERRAGGVTQNVAAFLKGLAACEGVDAAALEALAGACELRGCRASTLLDVECAAALRVSTAARVYRRCNRRVAFESCAWAGAPVSRKRRAARAA